MQEQSPKPQPPQSSGAKGTSESHDNRARLPWFETLWQDVRFGLRMLRKSPGFAIVALLTMALGIGATAAIFTVVNDVLLKPLDYPDPDKVVVMMNRSPQGDSAVISIPKYILFTQQAKVLEDFSIHDLGGLRVNLTGGDRPEQLRAMHASANFFSLIGIKLQQGRTYTPAEDVPNGPHVAVISNGLWRGRFGSDPNILGKTIDLDNDPYTVIGVMQPIPSADFADLDLYLPMQLDPNSDNQGNYLMGGARLKPGVTLAAANAELKVASEEFHRKYPAAMPPGMYFAVDTTQNVMVSGVRTSLLVLLGAVAFVLLIACANVANLLLARSTLRKREISIRAALGASRGRIARQMLTESVLLALGGGALGVYVGFVGVHALLSLNTSDLSKPGAIPRIGENASGIVLDWRVLLFALGISLLAGLLAGIVPAIKASRGDLATTLNESGRSGAGLQHNKTRSLLVVTEMALAMILLAGAALLIRTFHDLRTVNPGFETHNVLTMDMSLASARFEKTAAVGQLVQDARQRIQNLPGVEAVAASCCMPLEGGYGLPFDIEGRPLTNGPFTGGAGWRNISPGYFSAYRIPLIHGRDFTELDVQGSGPVV